MSFASHTSTFDKLLYAKYGVAVQQKNENGNLKSFVYKRSLHEARKYLVKAGLERVEPFEINFIRFCFVNKLMVLQKKRIIFPHCLRNGKYNLLLNRRKIKCRVKLY